MSAIPRGAWKFTVMLLLLLVLAAIASFVTIQFIETHLAAPAQELTTEESRDLIRVITIIILSMTMGFLFLAGALGVWAIRSTTQIETRRRIGRFVDAMDYLSDGLLAIDRRGRVTGLNPAARALACPNVGAKAGLREHFPCLKPEDAARLFDAEEPQEVECVSREPQSLRALRFRSQPSEDMNLILVSDITGQKAEEMRGRQVARLQLIGRIARGVAHDFSNILCAVSGYASVIERQKTPGPETLQSLKAIIREAQRGAALASQLLDLSRTGVRGNPCQRFAEHVEKAAGLLRVGLVADWQVISDIQGAFDAVPLTDSQVEQVILNLGLLAADELAKPGFVHIRVRPPGREALLDVGEDFAAVVLVSAYGPDPEVPDSLFHPEAQATATEAGVIQSVVRSVLEEVGGRLDVMVAPGSHHSYRLCMPTLGAAEGKMSAVSIVPEELRSYISNWKVLLAGELGARRREIEQRLKDIGITVRRADDIVAALQHVEADRELTAMIFDRALLGDEADALLRAILKLRPTAGLVVVCEAPESASQSLRSDCVFESYVAPADSMFQALVRATEMAGARKR